jgi:glycosyltransferase involved in cell wall biosynthesis
MYLHRALAMGSIAVTVVAPTYNNAGTLADVARRIAATGLPVIIVNDGSTDATAEILAAPPDGVTVIEHDRTRGKAAALRTGFERARELAFTHAVTVDTDGQLDPEQIPELVAAARRDPRALVIGARDDTRSDYPGRSRLGRRLSNWCLRLSCGATVTDSQCGFRVYPLAVTVLPCRSQHFGWETEIIARSVWAGHGIVNVPVRCRYFPAGERVSHLNPWRETLRAVGMHVRLTITRLLVPARIRGCGTPARPPPRPAAPAEDRDNAADR